MSENAPAWLLNQILPSRLFHRAFMTLRGIEFHPTKVISPEAPLMC